MFGAGQIWTSLLPLLSSPWAVWGFSWQCTFVLKKASTTSSWIRYQRWWANCSKPASFTVMTWISAKLSKSIKSVASADVGKGDWKQALPYSDETRTPQAAYSLFAVSVWTKHPNIHIFAFEMVLAVQWDLWSTSHTMILTQMCVVWCYAKKETSLQQLPAIISWLIVVSWFPGNVTVFMVT